MDDEPRTEGIRTAGLRGGDARERADRRVSRRAALAALGGLATTGLAGCRGLGDGGAGPSAGTATTDRPTATPTTDRRTATATTADEADPTVTTDAATTTEDPIAATSRSEVRLSPEAYGPPAEGEWRLTFEDQFDQGALDESVWSNGAWADSRCAGGNVDVCWARDHVAVDPDVDRLILAASDRRPTDDQGTDNQYTAGAVTTKDSFSQEFGYFEVAVRLPDQPGTLPACWLFCHPAEHDWREIDVVEKNGAQPGKTAKMGAFYEANEHSPAAEIEDQGPDNEGPERVGVRGGTDDRVRLATATNARPHVFAVSWGPEALAFYADGERVGQAVRPGVGEHMPGAPLFWLLNHSVHEPNAYLGDPADATFPTALEVSWVRTWQKAAWE